MLMTEPYLPIGGVASVWRPANWAGPNPSRNPVNCLSDANFTPGNIKLQKKKPFQETNVEKVPSVMKRGTLRTLRVWDPRRPGRGSAAV